MPTPCLGHLVLTEIRGTNFNRNEAAENEDDTHQEPSDWVIILAVSGQRGGVEERKGGGPECSVVPVLKHSFSILGSLRAPRNTLIAPALQVRGARRHTSKVVDASSNMMTVESMVEARLQ